MARSNGAGMISPFLPAVAVSLCCCYPSQISLSASGCCYPSYLARLLLHFQRWYLSNWPRYHACVRACMRVPLGGHRVIAS